MKKIIVIALLMIGAGLITWFRLSKPVNTDLVLYGNVDQRQIELAFLDAERVAEVLVQEGDIVQPGQVLARLETRRLRDKIAVAESQLASSEAVLLRLKNGTRPEEIDQARAAVNSAQAELAYADSNFKRYTLLWKNSRGQAVSKQDMDKAKLTLNMAQAKLQEAQKGLRLAQIGPRSEDIAQAEAQVGEHRQALTELRNQLGDAELKSPAASVVNRRLLEPGDMASPQRAVFSLAVLSPTWVRAYVSETDMGRIRLGQNATVHVDSAPDKSISGTVGFISSVAEFTPKSVETTELRTALVYEVRIHVDDVQNVLRLGMPATVCFPEASP